VKRIINWGLFYLFLISIGFNFGYVRAKQKIMRAVEETFVMFNTDEKEWSCNVDIVSSDEKTVVLNNCANKKIYTEL